MPGQYRVLVIAEWFATQVLSNIASPGLETFFFFLLQTTQVGNISEMLSTNLKTHFRGQFFVNHIFQQRFRA